MALTYRLVKGSALTYSELDGNFTHLQGEIDDLDTRVSYTVNAKDFGAVGDGITDDTIAMQAFIDSCKNSKGYIPVGIYKITSTLTLLPDFAYNIEGAAWDNEGITGTVIYNAGTGNAITLENEPYSANYDSEIRFVNLTIKGNASSLNGFYIRHCMIFLENVWSIFDGANGIFLERGYASSFRQVVCANNGQNGLTTNRAANALHFDHCIFNGNGTAGAGYAGCYINGFTDDYNYGIVFNACDFTGNGQSVATGYGCLIQYGRGVSLIGCYGEGNKTYNLYSDSTTTNLTVIGCYWQDANISIVGVDGLLYQNNAHQYASATTDLTITGGMPGDRLQTNVFGNTYMNGATATITAGASENMNVFYSSQPSGGTWKRGDIVWNNLISNGGGNLGWVCIVPGTPGDWIPIGQVPYTYENVADNDITLTPFSSFTTNFYQSPITNNRTVTLSTTGAVPGIKFRITRTVGATGAFTVNIGGLKALDAGQWCDVEYDGSGWRLAAFGSL